jgi:DNA-binding transcriptional MerR regulator
MRSAQAPLWTLDELSARVARALAVDYEGQASGRVRDVPDRRTIRYYTTLGLLDRPAAMKGRTALYGVRHLRQLVAIKRLQARGMTLAEVQDRLLGQTDAGLRQLARVPAEVETAEAVLPAEESQQAPDRRGGAFWREEPAPVRPPADRGEEAGAEVRPLIGVPLAEGVTLLLEASRPPDALDLSALQEAAAPLLEFLEARRLLDPRRPRAGGSTADGHPSFTKGETA